MNQDQFFIDEDVMTEKYRLNKSERKQLSCVSVNKTQTDLREQLYHHQHQHRNYNYDCQRQKKELAQQLSLQLNIIANLKSQILKYKTQFQLSSEKLKASQKQLDQNISGQDQQLKQILKLKNKLKQYKQKIKTYKQQIHLLNDNLNQQHLNLDTIKKLEQQTSQGNQITIQKLYSEKLEQLKIENDQRIQQMEQNHRKQIYKCQQQIVDVELEKNRTIDSLKQQIHDLQMQLDSKNKDNILIRENIFEIKNQQKYQHLKSEEWNNYLKKYQQIKLKYKKFKNESIQQIQDLKNKKDILEQQLQEEKNNKLERNKKQREEMREDLSKQIVSKISEQNYQEIYESNYKKIYLEVERKIKRENEEKILEMENENRKYQQQLMEIKEEYDRQIGEWKEKQMGVSQQDEEVQQLKQEYERRIQLLKQKHSQSKHQWTNVQQELMEEISKLKAYLDYVE